MAVAIDSNLKRHCLINQNVSIGHDTVVGKFCVVSPGCVLSGRTKIGSTTFRGCNVVTCPKMCIGSYCSVSASSAFARNLKDKNTLVLKQNTMALTREQFQRTSKLATSSQVFRIYGSGQPVVLIPGFAATASSWGFQYRWLKKNFKIIAIENSAVAKQENLDGNYDISTIASGINNILESCGVKQAALLGSSMGAMIALEFAQQYPERVSALILVSLPFHYSSSLQHLTEDMNSLIQDTADGDSFIRKLLQVFFSPAYVAQDHFRIFTDLFMQNGASFSKDVLFAQLRAVHEWLESKRWKEGCQCPCLFIYGSADQLISQENTANELATSFSKSEVKIIDGAGHAVHIEKYREFNNLIHEFMTKQK